MTSTPVLDHGVQETDRGERVVPQAVPPGPRVDETRRDKYIDTLRAAALVRVVAYHTFGFIWLPFVFPSMGIMFALAGALVASSLDRANHNPWRVVRKRTRRLLPPLWMLGLVLVPLMLAHGWVAVADQGGVDLGWRPILNWIIPLGDPGASDWGYQFTVPLWYIRAYFWFVLLSPAALFMFRRWPKRTMTLPLAVAALSGVGVLDYSLTGTQGSAIVATMATYGACWMLGFAHHDGKLRSLSLRWVLPVCLLLLVIGGLWAGTRRGWEIDDSTLGQALYCFGFVLLLLRFYPSFTWLSRHPILDKLITVINFRAMTIYLWGSVAIFLADLVLSRASLPSFIVNNDLAFTTNVFVVAWVLLGVAIFAFGWVEDVAAGRPARFNPWPKRVAQHRAVAPVWRVPIPRVASPRGLVAAFSLAGIAAAVAVFWVVSGDANDLPPTDGGAGPITALQEPALSDLRERSGADAETSGRSTTGQSEADEGGLLATLTRATDALLGSTPTVSVPVPATDVVPAPGGTSPGQGEPTSTSRPEQSSEPTPDGDTSPTGTKPTRTPRPTTTSTNGSSTSTPSSSGRPSQGTGSSDKPTSSPSNPRPTSSSTGGSSGQQSPGAGEPGGAQNADPGNNAGNSGGSAGNAESDGQRGGPSGTTAPRATSQPTPSATG